MKKGIAAILLISVLCGIFTAVNASEPAPAVYADTLPVGITLNCYGTINHNVNLRTEPSTNTPRVSGAPISAGTSIYLFENVTGSDGAVWTHVRVDEMEGYMKSEFIQVTDVPDLTSSPLPTPTPTPSPVPVMIPLQTLIPAATPPSNPFTGFMLRNSIMFGEYMSAVMAKEQLELTGEGVNVLEYKGTVASYQGKVEFTFNGIKGLTDMCYEIADSGNPSESHISIYDSLKNRLIKKYGMPLGFTGGKTHAFTGKAFEKAASMIFSPAGIMYNQTDYFDYDEWLIEYEEAAVKIDLVDFCYSISSNEMVYHVLLSYHFISSEDISNFIRKEEDKTKAIDTDI